MTNEHSPRVQLAEAIATVREFVAHALALAGMGIKLPLPRELEPLAQEIITMLNRTPQDVERSTAVSRDGVGTENRSDTTITGAATTVTVARKASPGVVDLLRAVQAFRDLFHKP